MALPKHGIGMSMPSMNVSREKSQKSIIALTLRLRLPRNRDTTARVRSCKDHPLTTPIALGPKTITTKQRANLLTNVDRAEQRLKHIRKLLADWQKNDGVILKVSCSSAVGLNSPLTWCVYGKVFDTGLPNRLRVGLHEFHDLERHTHFERKASVFASVAVSA